MDVGKNPNLKSYMWVAVAAALASTSLVEQAVCADQHQWSLVIAQAAVGAAVTQDDVETQPEAIFIMIPEQPVIGVAFRVDASQSFDRPDAGPIVNYLWSWGDGTANSNGVSVLHTYALSGRFTITLTVTDADTPSHSDSATKAVTIAASVPPTGGVNHAPTASLTVSPAEGSIDDEFTFDASGSKDADSDPLVYQFNFGDGHETNFTSVKVVAHEYAQAGNYVVRLTVRDDQNASTEITSSVKVLGPNEGNQPPVALIATGPRTGAAPVTLTFDGRISYDLDGDPLNYEWTISRGDLPYDTKSGTVVNPLFDQPGSYTVVLEVSDPDGASSTSDAETVTITERSDPVEPPPPAPIPEPEEPPPSYTQRPPSACGVGILTPMLACLMGLIGGRQFTRRRD